MTDRLVKPERLPESACQHLWYIGGDWVMVVYHDDGVVLMQGKSTCGRG